MQRSVSVVLGFVRCKGEPSHLWLYQQQVEWRRMHHAGSSNIKLTTWLANANKLLPCDDMADMQNIIRTIEIRHQGTVWFRISIHLCFGSSGHPTGVHGDLPTVMITYFTAANVWANGARGKRVTETVGRKVGNEMAKIPQCSEGTGEGLEFLWHPQSHQSMHQRLENKMEKWGWWMMGLNRLPSSNGLINLSIFDIPYVHNSFMTYYVSF